MLVKFGKIILVKGTAIKLTMEQVEQAKEKANQQLEGEWRLPTRKELESIVCFECGKVKINSQFFLTRLMNHFGLEKKILGIKISFGQLIFLLDILLEDFRVLSPIL